MIELGLPSSDEISLCMSIMNRITPNDLSLLTPEFIEAGHSLFGRSIKVCLFGEDDVVAFFKQKEDCCNCGSSG